MFELILRNFTQTKRTHQSLNLNQEKINKPRRRKGKGCLLYTTVTTIIISTTVAFAVNKKNLKSNSIDDRPQKKQKKTTTKKHHNDSTGINRCVLLKNFSFSFFAFFLPRQTKKTSMLPSFTALHTGQEPRKASQYLHEQTCLQGRKRTHGLRE
jgi:hypothetical protein